MPELPEVETLKLGIQKYVVGHKILDLEILAPRIFFGEKENLIGAKIEKVERVGKGLILQLDNGYSIAIHIKLTGQIIYRDEKTANIPVSDLKVGTVPNKFTHLIFTLDKGAKLYYNDQRRFGWFKLVKTEDVMTMPFFADMGPEPFKQLNEKGFQELISKSKTVIKPLIMDQKKIGGIGNIYANDGLFLAHIDPKRKANTLSSTEIKNLYESIHKVLQKGLDSGGASELTFVNILGQDGGYQKHTLVYGKRGIVCPNCKEDKIKFTKIGGRGTYFCPNCQK